MRKINSWLYCIGLGSLIFLCAYAMLYNVSHNESYVPPPKPKYQFHDHQQRLDVSQDLGSPVYAANTAIQEFSVHDSDTKVGENGKTPLKIIQCDHTTPRTYYAQRGEHWVLYNYIMAETTFKCDESITYTTHADFTFLDNLIPLLERWQGPLSISLYSPGFDFKESLERIYYLRECSGSLLVKQFVTFHLYFDIKSMPKQKIPSEPMSFIKFDCDTRNVTFGDDIVTFKKSNNLTYPVNVGRMIARDTANTFYVLPSDIELYPSPNLIPDFLEMIQRNNINSPDTVTQAPTKKVFVLPIFEADIKIDHLPYNKSELIDMINKKTVVPFHKYVCSYCHAIPKAQQWMKLSIKQGLRVFHVGKRQGAFQAWEPIYIGTKFDPGYDERLNWEGRRDKMTQGFALCVLDYEFHILDNAFLIHRPGIKRLNQVNQVKLTPFVRKVAGRQNYIVDKQIFPELKILYGTKNGCTV